MQNQIIIYQPEVGLSSLEVRLENETVWLNRQQISILFGRDIKTIGKHINNALKEELQGLLSSDNYFYRQRQLFLPV
ncbi:MAG TPA: DNA-binding protein, partial [bacterium]|nr:DNA-binding protein [bacterium]